MSRLSIVTALLVVSAGVAGAQQPAAPKPAAKKEMSESAMRAAAKVNEDSARKIALKAVPGSTVKAIEIEEEKGAVIWSVDLTVAGKTGIEEVNIDSKSGRILAKEHEDAAAEKAEAKAEAKEKAAKAAVKKP